MLTRCTKLTHVLAPPEARAQITSYDKYDNASGIRTLISHFYRIDSAEGLRRLAHMAERIESAVTGRSFQSFIALQVNHTMSMLPGKPVTSSEGVLWEDEGSLRVCVSAILIRVSSLLWARALQIDQPSAHEAANKPTIVSCCLAYSIVCRLCRRSTGRNLGRSFLRR